MAQEEGLISSIDDKGWAEVVTQRRDVCGDCEAGHCCTAFAGSSKILLKTRNIAGAKKGDLVVIDVGPGNVIQGAAILYIIPVLGLILGISIGSALDPGWPFKTADASTVFTFLGLALGLVVTVLISRRPSTRRHFTPVITRILKAGARQSGSLVAEDPICKAPLDPAQAPVSLDYQDKTFYFCGSGCRDTFAEHPEKYLCRNSNA
jgi:positive regulator of sigma E activity/YHS domain-containing protein